MVKKAEKRTVRIPNPEFEKYQSMSLKDLRRNLALCNHAIILGVLHPIYFEGRGMITYVLDLRAKAASQGRKAA